MARSGYDALTASSLNLSYDSDYASPKLFENKYFSATSPYYSTYTHNLGYIPSVFLFRKLSSTEWAHGMKDYMAQTPFYYAYYDDLLRLTSTQARVGCIYNVNTSAKVDEGTMAMFYLDPVENAEVSFKNTGPRISIARDGYDAQSGHPKDFKVDSRFDTFKVYKTGTLLLECPSVIAQTDTRTVYFEHNLGYIPFFTPLVPYTTNLHNIYFSGGGYTIPTNINVSNLSEYNFARVISTSSDEEEVVRVWVTSTRLYLQLFRQNYYGSTTFEERNITMNYTIFYNRVDEEFNLLEN